VVTSIEIVFTGARTEELHSLTPQFMRQNNNFQIFKIDEPRNIQINEKFTLITFTHALV